MTQRRVPPIAAALREAYEALEVASLAAHRDVRPSRKSQALHSAIGAAQRALEVPLLPGDEGHEECIANFGPHENHGQPPGSAYRNCAELLAAMSADVGDDEDVQAQMKHAYLFQL